MSYARNIIANQQKNRNLRVQPVTIQHDKIVVTEIASAEAIIKHTAVAAERIFISARSAKNPLICLQRTFILLHAGETIYFVATSRPGWYFIVNSTATSIPTPCTCVNGMNHEQCRHTCDVASYEAHQSVPQVVREAEEFIAWVLADKAAKAAGCAA